MAYSLAELKVRRHFQFFEARHSNGYFDKVIGLHPLADRVTQLNAPIERQRFSDRQDVIEARAAARGWPSWLFPLDVLLSQRRLLDHVCDIAVREKVSVICAMDPLYLGLFGLWVKRRTGLPVVVQVVANYDLNYDVTGILAMPRMFPFRWLEKWVIRSVLRKADMVAPGSETLREYAISQGVPPERTEVLRVSKYMVPAHRTEPAQRDPLTAAELKLLGNEKASKLLLTVARLEPLKMVDHSIRAFSIVARDHPDALLLIAGEGSEHGALEALARELGLADRVRFLGLVDQDFLSRLEPICLTLSPLTGMALFETSMAGSPAVAYNIDSACEEMVETGVTGALIKPKDWQEMGRAASRILGDPAMYSRMSEAIRKRAERLTDEVALYAREHAFYDRVIERGGHRRPE